MKVRDAGLFTSGLALGAGLTWHLPALGVVLMASFVMLVVAGFDWYRHTAGSQDGDLA